MTLNNFDAGKYVGLAVSIAKKHIKNIDDVKDMSQHMLLRLIETDKSKWNLDKYSIETYIGQTLRWAMFRKFRDDKGSEKRFFDGCISLMDSHIDDSLNPLEKVILLERVSNVNEKYEVLTTKQQQALKCLAFGMSPKEAAKLLVIKTTAYNRRVAAIRTKLQEEV